MPETLVNPFSRIEKLANPQPDGPVWLHNASSPSYKREPRIQVVDLVEGEATVTGFFTLKGWQVNGPATYWRESFTPSRLGIIGLNGVVVALLHRRSDSYPNPDPYIGGYLTDYIDTQARVYSPDGKLLMPTVTMPDSFPSITPVQCGLNSFYYTSPGGVTLCTLNSDLTLSTATLSANNSTQIQSVPGPFVSRQNPSVEVYVSDLLDPAEAVDYAPTAKGGMVLLYQLGFIVDYWEAPGNELGPPVEDEEDEVDPEDWPVQSVSLLASYSPRGELQNEYIIYGKGFDSIAGISPRFMPEGIVADGTSIPPVLVGDKAVRIRFGGTVVYTEDGEPIEHRLVSNDAVRRNRTPRVGYFVDGDGSLIESISGEQDSAGDHSVGFCYASPGTAVDFVRIPDPRPQAPGYAQFVLRDMPTGTEVLIPETRHASRAYRTACSVLGQPPWA